MKKEKDLINFSQLWSFGPILMVVIIFFYDFSHLIGLGLGGKFAFISAAGYIAIPTIIAAVLSFIFSKFKFKSSNFFKIWFWIMLITLISYFANTLVK
tara:strand:+ start:214 stop:507 length:294 start_codon:yes stop_codon:yes gene_type:complete